MGAGRDRRQPQLAAAHQSHEPLPGCVGHRDRPDHGGSGGGRQPEAALCRGHDRDPSGGFRGAATPSLGRRLAVRHGHANLGPEPEPAAHLDTAPDQRRPLAHLDQPEAVGAAQSRIGGADVEAIAVILDHRDDAVEAGRR